ncbi:ATP-binding cassette domain-containing protein [bacterium]|nr:ATP-binding cassette domain-containing protein [bacterium]
MSEFLIKVKDLNFKFPNQSTWFFVNLNFTINNDSKVVIYGKNGSGKSTLGKILVGLYIPTTGQVIENKTNKSSEFFSSMIFQNPDHQIIGSTVLEELALTSENLNISVNEMHELVNKTLTLFNLSKYQDTNIQALSGGNKQKLCIASCMITNPQLMIFDEAVSFLDASDQIKINELINSLHTKLHKTIILISHQLTDLIDADQVIYVTDNHEIKIYDAKTFLDLIASDQLPNIIGKSDLMQLNQTLHLPLFTTVKEAVKTLINHGQPN